jgi:hypothetical protein
LPLALEPPAQRFTDLVVVSLVAARLEIIALALRAGHRPSIMGVFRERTK